MIVPTFSHRCVVALVTSACVAVMVASGSTFQAYELTVHAPPDLRATAERIESADRTRVTEALALAGLRAPARLRILLIDEDHAAAQRDPRSIVGRAFGTDTIVIYPRRVGAYPYDSLDSVVLHEITHLALTMQAGGESLPRWFHEGVAVSVESGWGITSQLRLLLAAWREPAIDEVSALFASDQQPGTTTAYLLSAALVDDIRRRYGSTAPGQIATRVADGQSFDAAFVSHTGETPQHAAVLAWQTYRGLRWLPLLTSSSSMWGVILILAAVAFVVRRRRRRERWGGDDGYIE